MKKIKFTSNTDSAYGRPIGKTITYEGEFDAYENATEVRTANDMPSDDEVVTYRNGQRKAAANQARRLEVFNEMGIQKPTLENDVLLQLTTIYKTLVAAKKTPAEARQLAMTTLNVEAWPEELANLK